MIFFLGNSVNIGASTLLMITGLLIVALFKQEWKLVGVALISAWVLVFDKFHWMLCYFILEIILFALIFKSLSF